MQYSMNKNVDLAMLKSMRKIPFYPPKVNWVFSGQRPLLHLLGGGSE